MKLFVSYRSTDSSNVDPIVARLRSLGYEVWQDKTSIPPGQDWWEAICEGIVGCDVFLFMVSEESVKSFACLAELSYAHELNLPIIPFVIEGQWTYNAGGKHDVDFWGDIPEELTDSRAQFLFYEGANFVGKLNQGINTLLAKKMPRLPASPPPDPRKATDATNNVTVIYDEAYDFAYRGELEHAKKLFRKLVKHNDPVFGAISLEWVHIIEEYTRIKGMASRKSTRKIAQTQWDTYTAQFPKNFMDGVFDPANVEQLLTAKPAAIRQAPTVSAPPQQVVSVQTPSRPTTPSPLPSPFAWIEIPGGRGTLKTNESSVTLQIPTERYGISKYPITNAQYAPFVEAGGYRERKWWTDAGWQQREKDGWTEPRYWNDSKWNGAEQPVVGVSWYEAIAYCLWLSETTGEKIMLPTEAQWQYAAQGDDGRTYPWGKDWDCKRCNNSVKPCDSNQTTSVTQYEGQGDSPFGLVDMAGNVREWCLTEYKSGNSGINGTEVRVLRGGSWDFSSDIFRCGSRYRSNPNVRYDSWGFRLARSY